MRALVLGGKGDIGSAITQKLSLSGVEVIGTGRADFDLANSNQIAGYFRENGNQFDILIHSGGLNNPKTFEELTDAQIRESLDANVLGFLDVVRELTPYWKKSRFGRILVISSLYGFLARKGRLPYVMSKHALNGAVKTLAIELAPYGILVNALSPGYIATKLTYKNNSTETIERLISGIPVGRMGTPEDVAEVASFLCSPSNQYINGQDIVVDGGYSIGGFQN
jgi:NAD(P)-dependent dehydrogenase (short-subunit alcohol dehydrogenase family)